MEGVTKLTQVSTTSSSMLTVTNNTLGNRNVQDSDPFAKIPFSKKKQAVRITATNTDPFASIPVKKPTSSTDPFASIPVKKPSIPLPLKCTANPDSTQLSTQTCAFPATSQPPSHTPLSRQARRLLAQNIDTYHEHLFKPLVSQTELSPIETKQVRTTPISARGKGSSRSTHYSTSSNMSITAELCTTVLVTGYIVKPIHNHSMSHSSLSRDQGETS